MSSMIDLYPLIPQGILKLEVRALREVLDKEGKVLVLGPEFSGKSSLVKGLTSELASSGLKVKLITPLSEPLWESITSALESDADVIIIDDVNLLEIPEELLRSLGRTEKKLVITADPSSQISITEMIPNLAVFKVSGRLDSWQMLETIYRKTLLSHELESEVTPSKKLLKSLWYFTGGWLKELYLILKVIIDYLRDDQKPTMTRNFIEDLKESLEDLVSEKFRVETHNSQRSALTLLEKLSLPDEMPSWEDLYQKYHILLSYPKLINKVLWRVPRATRASYNSLRKTLLPRIKSFGLKPKEVWVFQSNSPVIDKILPLESDSRDARLEAIHFIISLLFSGDIAFIEFTLSDEEGNPSYVQVILSDVGHRFKGSNLASYLLRYFKDLGEDIDGLKVLDLKAAYINQALFNTLKGRAELIDNIIDHLRNRDIDKALELTVMGLANIDTFLALTNSAFLYLLKGSWERALKAVRRFERAAKIKSPTVALTKAYALTQIGMYEEALKTLEEAKEYVEPSGDQVIMHKLILHAPLSSEIDPFWDLYDSPNLEKLIDLSRYTVLSLMGKHDDVLAQLKKALESDPEDPLLLRVSTFAMARAGDQSWRELHAKLRDMKALPEDILKQDEELLSSLERRAKVTSS